MPHLLAVLRHITLVALLAAVGGVAGQHDLDSQCALQVSAKANRTALRVAIFMTTHWSEAHQQYLPCWARAVQQLPLLQNADLILYTSANISSSDLAQLHFRNTTVRKYVNHGWQRGATQAVKDAFGKNGFQEKWFADYDWVVRLNADVLIMDDTWLHKAMDNTSIDGIFGVCAPGINTDFFAVRPQAVNYTLVDECSGSSGAEKHFTCAIGNVLRSRRFTWVDGAEDKICRMVGPRSPVVHVHGFSRCCPDYLLPQANCSRLSGRPFPDPNAVIDALPPPGVVRPLRVSLFSGFTIRNAVD